MSREKRGAVCSAVRCILRSSYTERKGVPVFTKSNSKKKRWIIHTICAGESSLTLTFWVFLGRTTCGRERENGNRNIVSPPPPFRPLQFVDYFPEECPPHRSYHHHFPYIFCGDVTYVCIFGHFLCWNTNGGKIFIQKGGGNNR